MKMGMNLLSVVCRPQVHKRSNKALCRLLKVQSHIAGAHGTADIHKISQINKVTTAPADIIGFLLGIKIKEITKPCNFLYLLITSTGREEFHWVNVHGLIPKVVKSNCAR